MGLLPPMYDNGMLPVDGGYVNNLPVDVMKDLAPQVAEVIAVDVENKDNSTFENVSNYGDSLSVCSVCLCRLHSPHGIVPCSWGAVRVGGCLAK
jgi:predicted acylesterase/phospholipase RssA